MSFDAKDVENNKVIALLSYLGVLSLVPLLAKKDSKFCQEHGKQGFVLFLAEIACVVVRMVPVIGILGALGSLVCFVVAVIGIINVLQGKFWEIPVIGSYRKQVNF
jgi:uncharacterized membrane protein